MDSTVDKHAQPQSNEVELVQPSGLEGQQASNAGAPYGSRMKEYLQRCGLYDSDGEEEGRSNSDVATESLAEDSTQPKFTLFKNLPRELQDAIWNSAIESVGERVVQIRGDSTSNCPIPDVLHACRDSRRLALRRWKLSMRDNGTSRLFFDLNTDVLYLGPFILEYCRKLERAAVRKIAFCLRDQYDCRYYETGSDLAVTLHQDFPGLREVTFVEKNVNYDWERHERGVAQPPENLERTVITFVPPMREIDEDERDEILRQYRRREWKCPVVRYMDYERTYPRSWEPKAFGDEDEELYTTIWSDDESMDDEAEFEDGGWLDEVPNAQLRFVLARNPELRSYFGF